MNEKLKTSDLMILLEQERSKLGISREKFAVANLGISNASYSLYLNGREMKIESIRNIAAALPDKPHIIDALVSYVLGYPVKVSRA